MDSMKTQNSPGEYACVDISCAGIIACPAQSQGPSTHLRQNAGSSNKPGVARRSIVSAGRQGMRTEINSCPSNAGQRADRLIRQARYRAWLSSQ